MPRLRRRLHQAETLFVGASLVRQREERSEKKLFFCLFFSDVFFQSIEKKMTPFIVHRLFFSVL